MSIRQYLEYSGKKYHGYVDFGSEIENDKTYIAKNALVFLFVCMNAAWKIPVGYFFNNGIDANQKSNLIEQCIRLLHDAGVTVSALTFDGDSTNISAVKKLGCNLKLNSLQTWFAHPVAKQKIFIFLDPCHMIKLIRNAFKKYRTLVDGLSQQQIK